MLILTVAVGIDAGDLKQDEDVTFDTIAARLNDYIENEVRGGEARAGEVTCTLQRSDVAPGNDPPRTRRAGCIAEAPRKAEALAARPNMAVARTSMEI